MQKFFVVVYKFKSLFFWGKYEISWNISPPHYKALYTRSQHISSQQLLFPSSFSLSSISHCPWLLTAFLLFLWLGLASASGSKSGCCCCCWWSSSSGCKSYAGAGRCPSSTIRLEKGKQKWFKLEYSWAKTKTYAENTFIKSTDEPCEGMLQGKRPSNFELYCIYVYRAIIKSDAPQKTSWEDSKSLE